MEPNRKIRIKDSVKNAVIILALLAIVYFMARPHPCTDNPLRGDFYTPDCQTEGRCKR